jgi:hypothetical protein
VAVVIVVAVRDGTMSGMSQSPLELNLPERRLMVSCGVVALSMILSRFLTGGSSEKTDDVMWLSGLSCALEQGRRKRTPLGLPYTRVLWS